MADSLIKQKEYKVWLVRSPEYSKIEYWNVFNLLKSIPGVIKFFTKEAQSEEDLEEDEQKETISSTEPANEHEQAWFFEQCANFRRQEDIGKTDIVIYLTNLKNDNNLFMNLDYETRIDAYVQTSDYEKYVPGTDTRYPVAYHIVAAVLVLQWFDTGEEAKNAMNIYRSVGSILDKCNHKKDVILKLRTADFSEAEIESLKEKNVDPNLINHVLDILENIRKFMLYKTLWTFKPQLFTLTINLNTYQFYFEEFGNIEVNLNPQEKAFYLTFLRYVEGVDINRNRFFRRYGNDMLEFYDRVKPPKCRKQDQEYQDRVARIERVCNNFSYFRTKIEDAFTAILGNALAQYYIIPKEADQQIRKIEIDRSYIKFVHTKLKGWKDPDIPQFEYK